MQFMRFQIDQTKSQNFDQFITKNQMLNLNVQIGLNPLQKHKPIYFKTYQQLSIPYSFTIGQDGEIVAWKMSQSLPSQSQQLSSQNSNPSYLPVYYMIPSINGDHEKCVAIIVTQLRLINKEQKTYKVVTYHTDNRIRIWQLKDGSCINISSHNFFSEKVIGLCENTNNQTRFLFSFSQNSIFIIDCWTMTVVQKIQPKKEVYSQFLKGRINEKKQLQLYDNYHKSYKLDVSRLFKDSFIDVGRTINSLDKVQKELKEIIESFHHQKLVLIHKVWKTEDYKTPLKKIIDSQISLLEKSSILTYIFDQAFIRQTPEIQSIFQSIEITVENLFFIKGAHLWYFIGTDQGKIYGFPAVKEKRNEYFAVKEESNFSLGRKNAVKYMSLVDNLLICSWQNGDFKAYTTDNIIYMIEQQIPKLKNQKPQQNTNFHLFQLDNLCISRQKFSSPVKHCLPIYLLSTNPSINSTKVGSQETAFQLENNEVVIFDSLHHKVSHFVGIEEKKKIYVVLYMTGSNEYVGFGTQDGIEVFGLEGYERRISYRDWEWKQWALVSKYQCKQDSNNFHQQGSKGLGLIQFSNRHTINQIAYTSSLTSLLQETFGPINTQNFDNEIYSKFYFLQKLQAQKTLHSRSLQNFIAVLRHKHNSYRRDNSINTSFLVNCSLNKELDVYSNVPAQQTLEETIEGNFVFYSCFLWDLFDVPFLSPLMKKLDKSFVLKRRFASQGLGKTATLYFDHEQAVFGLSKYILTEYAIAAISFMQCYVLKEIEKADQLVSVVEFFTLSRQRTPQIYISGQILSKSIISSNQNIVKACINLLISTIIAGHLNIHPLWEYFVLNLKNMEEEKQSSQIINQSQNQNQNLNQGSASKNVSSGMGVIFPLISKHQGSSCKQLTEIECEWLLYLGLGLIYGKGSVQKQQVKMLLNRIIQCIELVNFIKKPDLVQVVLKLLNQGLSQTWKQLLTKETVIKLYLDLFRVFFFYDGIGNIPSEDKKFNFCFQNNSTQQIKRMKQSIIKTIVYLSKDFNNEFIQCLTTETINQKPHHAYPASVIEILRQYLKSEKPTAYLVFYIELLLQCLSPMTPNLRKYVQKNVISTLQLMCTYKSVSFNQVSQRLSIKSNNHLYIYCLRTSTKWRTISLHKEEGKQEIEGVRDEDCALQMSPKGNYIALMTYQKLYVWRLSSGFWSGLLGAFSQRESFDIPKGGRGINIVWEQNQSSITVVNQDPSLNKAFRV